MRPNRRSSREFALQGIYQWIYTGVSAQQVLNNLSEMEGFEGADREFLETELRGTINESASLQALLEPLVDRKWADIQKSL